MTKRFFELNDADCVWYVVVAVDLDHAKNIVRKSGVRFGEDSVPLDEAQDLEWSELSKEQVARRQRCHTEDHRGVIPLADAGIGEWFSTEW